MYKTFIIGNPESVWIREYVKEIHIKKEHEVYIGTFDRISDKMAVEYELLGVKIVEFGHINGIVGKIQKTLRLLFFAIRHSKKNSQFDIFEIQGVPHSFQAKVLYLVSKILRTRVFIAFWGSDILAINEMSAKRIKSLLKVSDYINIGTENIYNAFTGYYGHYFDKKIVSVAFGSLAFADIKKSKELYTKNECKKIMHFNNKKTIIAVGYNGKPEQQHIKVINQLSKLSNDDKDKIQIVIHLGYGSEEIYTKMIINAAEKSGIEYTIIPEMLDLSKISILRLATDIFLHAQVTDALSGTIRECIYAGAVLVNPIWINYQEYDDFGIEYVQYSTFSELPRIISGLINNNSSINTNMNSEIVYNNYSWEAVRDNWQRIFDNGIN